jgi:hypothetical protein
MLEGSELLRIRVITIFDEKQSYNTSSVFRKWIVNPLETRPLVDLNEKKLLSVYFFIFQVF